MLESKLAIKDYFPLIGSAVIILLFTIQRVMEYRLRKKEISRNWYLKMMVEPHSKLLTEFFQNIQDQYQDSAKSLTDGMDQNADAFLKLKALELGKFSEKKLAFVLAVIQPIQLLYPEHAPALSAVMVDIEDVYSTNLDQNKITDREIQDVKSKIGEYKAKLLSALYSPLFPVKKKFFGKA